MSTGKLRVGERVFADGHEHCAPTGFGVVTKTEYGKQRVHVQLLDGQTFMFMVGTVTRASVIADFLQAARVEGKN